MIVVWFFFFFTYLYKYYTFFYITFNKIFLHWISYFCIYIFLHLVKEKNHHGNINLYIKLTTKKKIKVRIIFLEKYKWFWMF